MPKVNLYIGNLDDDVDEEYLKEEFRRFGTVLSAAVMKGRHHASLGYGFVCFDSLRAAEEAIHEMNGTKLLSKCITVSVAENQQRKYLHQPYRDPFRPKNSVRSNSPDSSTYSTEHRKYRQLLDEDSFRSKKSSRSSSPDSTRCSSKHKMPFENKNRPDTKMKWRSRCNLESDSSSQVSSSSACSGDWGAECPEASNVARRIRSLYEDQLFTDVKFIINNDGKTKSLTAHKAILAVGSPMFQETLYGDSAGYQAEAISEINISDITFDTFKNIVEYLYTDEVFFEDNASAVAILRGAKQYKVQSLIDRCESYFESIEITENNACSMLQISISNNIESLKNRCVSFIQENTSDVIRSSDFKNSPINTVRNICKLPKLNLRSEVDLFEAIMLWADCCRKEGANKRSFIDPLLKCIRFLTMKTDHFASLMRKYPDVLTNEEKVSILMHSTSSEETAFSSKSLCSIRENRCTFSRPAASPKLADTRAVIPLRPCKVPQDLKNLKCVLEMVCLEGFHELTSVKLSFEEPVPKGSLIVLVMNITCVNTGFNVVEPISIRDSNSVTVPLSKSLYVRRGDKIRIVAVTQKIEQYRFYQFDEEELMSSNSCFRCNVGSSPSKNRLFFISEIIFKPRLKAQTYAKRYV